MVPIDSTACLHFQYFGIFLRFTTETSNNLLNMFGRKNMQNFLQYFCVAFLVLHHTKKPILYFHKS
jgi:hypothetical protein